MEYICEVCGEKIIGDSLKYIDHTEQHIVDLIKESHPDWAEDNGMCQKCHEYYKKQLRGEQSVRNKEFYRQIKVLRKRSNVRDKMKK